MDHKSGFVNIIGKPNVGKSTLMNLLVGEKLSVITSKAQTTRNRILGILNGSDYQIVFSDTPGILEPSYKLQEIMLKSTRSALEDADVIIYLTDISEKPNPDEEFIRKIRSAEVPVLLVLNKIDLSDPDSVLELIGQWNTVLPDAEKIPASALKRFNVDFIFERILHHLPVALPFYPKDQLTDKSERFFAGEFIREKILLHFKQEIPYSVEIEIDHFKETGNLLRIHGIIYVERESQKGILIGRNGLALKRVAREARLEMEQFFRKKIFLELLVKVKKDWRNNEREIRKFGYR
ncbi:MAG: GTPase Era [Bacteroidales bacterium]|nr:GTPase Era [Bacteroidales bacterium]